MAVRRARRILRRVVFVTLAAGFVWWLVAFVAVWSAARRDEADATRPADAIVVLGAAQYDGRPSPVLAARLDHAVALWRDGVAPLIVVTGGKQPGDRFTEATAAANHLHEAGVPDSAILREVDGRSSWESLVATARFLHADDKDAVVLVSDPYHMARIGDVAREVGLDASTSPAADSPVDGWEEKRRFVAESLKVAVGRLIGYGRLERHGRIGKLVPGLATMLTLPIGGSSTGGTPDSGSGGWRFESSPPSPIAPHRHIARRRRLGRARTRSGPVV